MRTFSLILLAFAVTACGVQRPLIRPKDIPAYEEQQRQKREEIEQEQRELKAIDEKRAAERASPPEASTP